MNFEIGEPTPFNQRDFEIAGRPDLPTMHFEIDRRPSQTRLIIALQLYQQMVYNV